MEIFYSKCKSRMSDPIVENGFLNISSADIFNFLSAIEVNDETQFAWFRLRSEAMKVISKKKLHKRAPLLLQHYEQCGKMLKGPI